jgi:hypothetical protein
VGYAARLVCFPAPSDVWRRCVSHCATTRFLCLSAIQTIHVWSTHWLLEPGRKPAAPEQFPGWPVPQLVARDFSSTFPSADLLQGQLGALLIKLLKTVKAVARVAHHFASFSYACVECIDEHLGPVGQGVRGPPTSGPASKKFPLLEANQIATPRAQADRLCTGFRKMAKSISSFTTLLRTFRRNSNSSGNKFRS